MYYTITLNPAVDMLVVADNFALGKLNRTKEAKYVVGGKGINISMLLKNIGVDTKALGFVAGFTGYFIKSELDKLNVAYDFVETLGATRINMKLTTETETEINGQSSKVTEKNIAEFFEKLDNLTSDDVVFLSGNVISGMGVEDFKQIAKKISEIGAMLVVDSNKDLVLDTLEYKPFVVKPNEFELGEMFGVTLNSLEDILTYAGKLKERGAKNVIVSRGANGAILLTENNEVFEVNVAKGEIVSTVAAGDSMLAMFVAKYNQTHDYREALKYASAAGGATSFSVGVGSKDLIEKLVSQIEVTKIK
ncbi:1-phosphofructokinase family hexose kinase [Gemella cuniculi]|uniref:1-phosphofructokinase family hexose kinase n=1 Tax=Gemella cuniculi TaxID=150240 RepID=UPI00041B52AD|nr:1-phosphofructokinase family hexose kinase [Gemella cuniculi]